MTMKMLVLTWINLEAADDILESICFSTVTNKRSRPQEPSYHDPRPWSYFTDLIQVREGDYVPFTSLWANPRQTTADVSAVIQAKALFVPSVDIWVP